MKRLLPVCVASLGFLAVSAAGRATAQGYPYNPQVGSPYPYYQRSLGSYPSPALSPYLNLLRGGNPAANYFMGTLPELDRRAANLAFGSAILGIDQRLALNPELEGLNAPLNQTGHPTYFNLTGSYYNFGGAYRPGALGQYPSQTQRRPATPRPGL